jgi:hypothetical protein
MVGGLLSEPCAFESGETQGVQVSGTGNLKSAASASHGRSVDGQSLTSEILLDLPHHRVKWLVQRIARRAEVRHLRR